MKLPPDLWRRTWYDKHGQIVIAQWPSAWLWGWAAATTLSVLTNGVVADVFGWMGIASLAVWVFYEVKDGVNYFRRGLGILVGVFVIMSIIKSL